MLGGKVYLVGRKECDILVPTDATVSRKHAEITVTHPDANLVSLDNVYIKTTYLVLTKNGSNLDFLVKIVEVNEGRIFNEQFSLTFCWFLSGIYLLKSNCSPNLVRLNFILNIFHFFKS